MRLGDIILGSDAGKSPQCEDKPCENGSWGVIKTTAIQENGFFPSQNKTLPSDFVVSPNQIIHKGDLLITRAGPRNRTGILCLVEKDIDHLILSDKTIRLNYIICDALYIKNVLVSPAGKSDIENYMTGMAASQVNISQQNMRLFCIPLPPLAEQHRIVDRVNTLMKKIDALQTIEDELQSLKQAFPGNMRDAILQAAMQGKLTEQLESDGTAEELLEEIKNEKERLIKEGKIKKEKTLPEFSEDEIPFDIPENWKWCRLGEIVLRDIGGGTPDKSEPKYWNGKIPWMSVKDFSNANNGVILDTIDHITCLGVENSSTNVIDVDAIILCTRMGLGKYAKLLKKTAINQDLRAIWISRYVDEEFFLRFYSSIHIEGTGTTVKGIKRNELLNWLVPLPPLAEQHRIVARLNELLPLCDTLEEAK